MPAAPARGGFLHSCLAPALMPTVEKRFYVVFRWDCISMAVVDPVSSVASIRGWDLRLSGFMPRYVPAAGADAALPASRGRDGGGRQLAASLAWLRRACRIPFFFRLFSRS